MAAESLLQKLDDLEARFHEVSLLITDPAVIADMKRFVKLNREYRDLERISQSRAEYVSLLSNISQAKELLGESDPEMRQMAREELESATTRLETLEEEIKQLLIPADPQDDKDVVMEIRGGTGGDEAALFAGDLFRMYCKYFETKGWKYAVSSCTEGTAGGFKEIIFTVSGEKVYGTLKYESGVHRVQRVPVTETQGRIHTSAATVAVLPEADAFEVEINEGEIKWDTFRSGGAGGQNVNKVSSAIRITHLPTGIVVQCQNERSQLQNKEMAMRILKGRLLELQEREREAQMAELKGVMKKIEWGSQIRSYVFQPYTLVKDHRTGVENGNIQAVMDGDLDAFISEYLVQS